MNALKCRTLAREMLLSQLDTAKISLQYLGYTPKILSTMKKK